MPEDILGKLYVIAAPSGGGKTSLVRALIKQLDHLKVSISHTTRLPRPGEVEGRDYHFVDQSRFQAMVASKDFLEYAEIYGHFYGTSHHWVLKQLRQCIDVILEIDWQGARQIRQLFPSTVSIFILPPSKAVLLERLRKRKQDSDAVIDQRMKEAIREIGHSHEFDYLILNDTFSQALNDMIHIIQAERLRSQRWHLNSAKLLANLLEKQ